MPPPPQHTTASPTLVDLGYAGPIPRYAHDLHHRLYHLPNDKLIVVAQTRDHTGWRCTVIATHSERRLAHFTLTDAGLATAATRITVAPHTHRGDFLLLWQTRVHQRWHHARMDTVAHTLTTTLRQPGSLHVDIDPAATGYLNTIARLRPPALTILLNRLTTTGMLTAADAATGPGHNPLRFRLALPELGPTTPRPAPEHKTAGVADVG